MSVRIVPTMIFTGFLEAGKTSFIQKFLGSGEVNRYEHILLLVCEEGPTEYEPARFKSEYVKLLTVGAQDMPCPEMLAGLADEFRANRVIIEHNGMRSLAEFLGGLPKSFEVSQINMLVDGSSFGLYSANMRPQTVDKLRLADNIYINRANGLDENSFAKLIDACAPKAAIYYEDGDGRLTAVRLRRPIPTGSGGALSMPEDCYSAVYRDIFTHMDEYEGRRLKLSGRLIRDAFGGCAVGRYTMVCCMDDLAFAGFACKTDIDLKSLEGEWVTAEGVLELSYLRAYGQRGPALRLNHVETATAPVNEILLP